MNSKNTTYLNMMKNGQNGIIIGFNGGQGILSKLESMGIRRGSKIIKKSAIIAAGPIIVATGGTQLAIGYRMAKKIVVEVCK